MADDELFEWRVTYKQIDFAERSDIWNEKAARLMYDGIRQYEDVEWVRLERRVVRPWLPVAYQDHGGTVPAE
jgi:hypothetical protein